MLIEMGIKKDTNDINPIPEICEFKGMRWNNYGFAIIYTNHSRHDYIMPMEKDSYVEMEKSIKKAYIDKARLIELSGDVFRVNKDNYTLSKKKSANWKIKVAQ